MEKIKLLRAKVSPVLFNISTEVSTPSIVSGPFPESNTSSEAVNMRKIRNRASALLSRKRKSDQMELLQSQVKSLLSEVDYLKKRLSIYEQVPTSSSFSVSNGLNLCYYHGEELEGKINCNFLEPAVFKL
jgi:hypothetical protein